MSLILARWLATVLLPLGALLLVGALLLLLGRPRPRHLCPGPRRSILARLNPLAALLREPCLYDLGASPVVDDRVTCPECGGSATPRQLRRSAPSLRPLALALLLFLPGALCFHLVTRGDWRQPQRALPTTAVILIKHAWPGGPGRMHPELERRSADGSLHPWQARLAMPSLVRDLHSEADWNQTLIARRLLRTYRAAAQPELEAVLHSPDWQQRHRAADLLRSFNPAVPSEMLIRTSVEGLRPSASGNLQLQYLSSRRDLVGFLRRHLALAEHHLTSGLYSDDAQQRLYCAFILGLSGVENRASLAAPVLAQSLCSNGIDDDARLAVYGLAGFGQAAIPCLESLLQSGDDQQRTAALLLLQRLTGVDTDAQLSRLLSRGRGIRLTGTPQDWWW